MFANVNHQNLHDLGQLTPRTKGEFALQEAAQAELFHRIDSSIQIAAELAALYGPRPGGTRVLGPRKAAQAERPHPVTIAAVMAVLALQEEA